MFIEFVDEKFNDGQQLALLFLRALRLQGPDQASAVIRYWPLCEAHAIGLVISQHPPAI